jgi:hypothetical protein
MTVTPTTAAPVTVPAPPETKSDDTVTINGFQKKLVICVDGKEITGKLRTEGKLADTIDKIQNLLQSEYFGSDHQLAENESAKINKEKGVITDPSGAVSHTYKHMDNGEQTAQGKVFSKIEEIIQKVFKSLSEENRSGEQNGDGGASAAQVVSPASSPAVKDEEEGEVHTKIKIKETESDEEDPSKPIQAGTTHARDGDRIEDLQAQAAKIQRDLEEAEKEKAKKVARLQQE